ncbi:flagellar hook protein FlgE [Legionella sp. CNM-4043-24]|uniref:flagellar hook protein FlgE n=1 Tax=Legionella sp. CNM-4043-24 TaxID=3421646 RepID=UPI00403B2C5A
MGMGNIANTGIKAAMTNMENISNNIANVNTIGFKKSQINFADVYASSFASKQQVGFGVQTQAIRQNFSMGRIESTDNGLDLCLGNDGFFVQKNKSGQAVYTRNGQLSLDKEGYLVGNTGRLQGYPAVNGSIVSAGVLNDLQITQNALPAKATTNAQLVLNLDASSDVKTAAFDATDTTTYNFRTDTRIFDSLGQSYPMSVYYVKTADNSWTAQVMMDTQSIGSGTVTFQSSGALDTVNGLDTLSWTPTGGAATPQPLAISLTDSTQFSGESKKYSADQDGYAAGVPTGYLIDGDGKINVYYSNDQKQVQGQIAVAQFRAPQGLSRTENMSWLATNESGDPFVDPATSMGAIGTNKLEYSNVDLTTELVSLMGAQHDFQANAQVVQTYNQVLQTIENI